MAVTAAEIRAILTLQDQLSGQLSKVQGELHKLGASATASGNAAKSAGPSWASMSTAIAAGTVAANAFMGAVKGIGGLVSGAVSTFGDYEAQMNILRVTTGATEEQMAAMAKQARELGADLDLPATSSAGAARAMVELAKGGLDVANTQKAVKGALQLAAAAGIDEAKAAQMMTGALNAFGLSGEHATKIANQLAYAANASALDATDLAQGFAQAGFIFKAAGRPAEELTSALIVLGNAGLSGSDGATALKNAFMQALSPTKEAMGVMKQYGISLFDAKGNMKALPDIIDHLNDRLDRLTPQQRNSALAAMFQSDGMKALIPLLAVGGDKLREYERNLENTNAASEQSEARSKGVQGALKGLNSQWETLQETVGGKVAPALGGGIRLLSDLLGEVNKLAENADFATFGANAQAGMKNASDGLYAAGQAASEFGEKVKDVPVVGGPLNTFLQIAGSVATGLAAILRGDAKGAIDAFGNAIGQAGGKIGELAALVQPAIDKAVEIGSTILTAAEKAGQQGAWLSLGEAFKNIADSGTTMRDRLNEISTSLETSGRSAGLVLTPTQALAAVIRGAALGFQYATLQIQGWIDTAGSYLNIGIRLTSGIDSLGLAMRKLARGDIDGMRNSLVDAREAFGDAAKAAEEARTRGIERFAESGRIMAQTYGQGVAQVPAITEQNLSRATDITDVSSREIARLLGAGMQDAVVAVETQAPAATAAVETMSEGMVSGLEAAAPEMAAAAESGAADAVSAVDAQIGPANASGQALGVNIGSGLVAGIASMGAAVWNAVKGLVNTAIGAGNQEAEVESPSKRTFETGKFMGEGYIEGLASMAPEMAARVRDFLDASMEYVPVAGEIARVEKEIAAIRSKAQTDALWRSKEMIAVDSEALRLKQATATLERNMVGIRQDLARASREVADIERGSLGDRTKTIELDGQRKQLRLQQIDLERQLIGLDPDSKKAKRIEEQIAKLRDQDRLLSLEAEQIQLTNDVAAVGARIKREGLDDQVRGHEAVIQSIKDQLDVLALEQALFAANEAIIKNATDNEVAERERLIAVFKAEGAPILERINAGLLLIDQLEKEGAISTELADQLRNVAKEAGASTTATEALGKAGLIAAPGIDAAAKKAEEMAKQAAAIGKAADGATDDVLELGETIGKLPGIGKVDAIFKPDRRALGGMVSMGTPYIVGEQGPEMFVPNGDGTILPASATAALLDGSSGGSTGRAGGGGGTTREVHVHLEGAQIYGFNDFENAVQRAVGRGLKRGQFGG